MLRELCPSRGQEVDCIQWCIRPQFPPKWIFERTSIIRLYYRSITISGLRRQISIIVGNQSSIHGEQLGLKVPQNVKFQIVTYERSALDCIIQFSTICVCPSHWTIVLCVWWTLVQEERFPTFNVPELNSPRTITSLLNSWSNNCFTFSSNSPLREKNISWC